MFGGEVDVIQQLAADEQASGILGYLLQTFRLQGLDSVVRARSWAPSRAADVYGPLDGWSRGRLASERLCKTQLFRAFLEEGGLDHFDCFSDHANYGYTGGIYAFSEEALVDIFLGSLPITLSSMPFQHRFECAMHMGSDATVEDFLRVCGIPNVTAELASATTSMGFTALHFCVVSTPHLA